MFDTHQPEIAAHAWASADGLSRAALFTLASIRQPFARAVSQVRRDAPNASRLARIRQCARQFRGASARHLDTLGRISDADSALYYLAGKVPGLALAKGGFLVQMLYGEVGCLDSVNAGLYGIPVEQAASYSHFKCAGRHEKGRLLRRYVAHCRAIGGSRYLWDAWCGAIASHPGVQRQQWRDAEHVSAAHVAAVLGAKL